MKHAPATYVCPFWGIAATLQTPAPEPAVVLVEPRVFAFVPPHCACAPRLGSAGVSS
jgi:histidine triad (HIT) family protein